MILERIFLGNSIESYLVSFLVFLGAVLLLKVFQAVVVKKLKKIAEKTKTDFDDVLVDIVVGLKPSFYYLVSLYLAFSFLSTSGIFDKILEIFFISIIVWEIIRAAEKVVGYFLTKLLMKQTDSDKEAVESTVKTISIFIKIILWSVGLVLVLANLGINVSALITGMGISGIALALALQSVFADIFASFSIIIDKPFKVGDFIKIGNDSGTVDHIGIKTTRLITLVGDELVIANQELTSARVQNFKKMEKRRVVFGLGLIYETSSEKLRKVPEIIEDEIKKVSGIEFDRSHFKGYGDFSLDFETVYSVLSQDYAEYMNKNQEINLNIFERFAKEGLEFAYPTNVQYEKKLD
jgi:small-conductance mechanosensitive channel